METTLHIEAGARKVGIYNLNGLESDEIDLAAYDLESAEELRRFIDDIDAMVESGELTLLERAVTVTGIDPETVEVLSLVSEGEEEERELDIDRFRLKNLSPFEALEVFENADAGAIFYLRSEEGIGTWDLKADLPQTPEEPTVEMGYFDCSGELDSYELLRESYLDYLCDTLIPSECRIEDANADADRFDFEPVRIEGALYRVATDPESGLRTLERLPCPSRIFLDLYAEE